MAPRRTALAAAALASQALVAAGYPSFQELFYEQQLDHFDPTSATRWQHRYLLNNETWDGRGMLPGGCRGPILVYTGNEGDIEDFWPGNGFMVEVLAPTLGGLLVFPEERFYGKSLPCGPNSTSTTDCLRYLTTGQVLEDFAELLAHLRATLPGARGCPAVAFGGSYGGTLAALLRATHPETVAGALAASSELGYYDVDGWASHGVDAFTFQDIVARNYDEAEPRCLASVKAAAAAIEAATQAEVEAAFNVCEPRALGPSRSDLFVYALEGLPQLNYPYAVGSLPGNPVKHACSELVSAASAVDAPKALIQAAASVTAWALGGAAAACIPYLGVGGPGNTPGDGPGLGAWGWQSCTETLHTFSARTLRNYTFDLGTSTSLCSSLYKRTVSPDTSLLARRYGGYALADGSAGVTRLIWSHGLLDPWHGWFQSMPTPAPGSDVHHVVMEGAAHHLDLKSPSPDDPPAVTAGRARELEIIRRWLSEEAAAAAVSIVV